MRLIHTRTNQPVVEFQKDETVFFSNLLKKEMELIGINIPHGLRGVYQGKACIYLEDPEFQQAFKEVYYLSYLDPSHFEWKS